MIEQGGISTGADQALEVENMHERKQLMADLSDAVIALPGGCGTLEELLRSHYLETIGTVSESDSHIEYQGYFDPLLAMLQKAVDENFMRAQHGAIWHVVATAGEAVERYIPGTFGMPLSVSLQRYDELVGGMDTRWSGSVPIPILREWTTASPLCCYVVFSVGLCAFP